MQRKTEGAENPTKSRQNEYNKSYEKGIFYWSHLFAIHNCWI